MSQIKLNPAQLKAVKHIKGPLLIVAGAGTGKTTVITEHIKHLIKSKKIDSQSVLALTFTDKASSEMLERLDQVMPLGYQEPWLSTFHSFGKRLLQQEALEIGLDPGFRLLTRPEQWIFIKQNLFNLPLKHYLPLGNPTRFISALITFFSRAQDEDVSPDEIIALAKKKKDKPLLEVGNTFKKYQQLKIKKSLLDYGDLIAHTLHLFRTKKGILENYRKQFQHILVDEFQDTNFSQFELIKLLAPPSKNPNLIVVGDDDQAIYKFRGASVSNILDFKKTYPKSKTVTLTKNYRSIKPILDSAYHLIQNNNPDRLEKKLKINKRLTSTNKKKTSSKPQIVPFQGSQNEVEWIIEKISSLAAKENYTYKDFAILTRSNANLQAFVSALKRLGLPYQLIGNRGLLDQPPIKELIYFLQVVADPDSSISLFQFLHSHIFDINPKDILKLIQTSRSRKISLWHILTKQKKKHFQKAVRLIKSAQDLVAKEPPTKILYLILLKTTFIKAYVDEASIESELAIKNINLFLNLVKRFELATKDSTLLELVDYLNLMEEAGSNPAQAEIEDIDTISLITIHSAKGLEFPVVFIPSLVTGRFPAINRRDPIVFPDDLIKETLPQGNANIQEERRLLYVGITRAKDYLYLTWSNDYGGVRKRHPSGFLQETLLSQSEIPSQESTQLSILSVSPKSPKPIKIKHGKVEIKSVSYSQIDTFKTCPLKYKYRYILRIPSAPHHALSFGQSIHDTLRHFHALELKGKKPSLKNLLTLYKKYFREEGYDSKEHKITRKKDGEKSLKKYFSIYKDKLGSPVELEKDFRISISGVSLVGKIDRIDRVGPAPNEAKGEVGDSYEIIDYKTGKSKEKKDVDKDEQLSIYALGAKHALGFMPKALSLFFLESNEKVSTSRSSKDLKLTMTRLKKRIQEMKTSKFPAKPGAFFPCSFCEYSRICPYSAKKN